VQATTGGVFDEIRFLGVEKTPNNGDTSDYLVRGVTTHERTLTANTQGDHISLGIGTGIDTHKDTVVYREGDGFDVVVGFDLARDNLQIDVATTGNWLRQDVMFEGVLSTLIYDTTAGGDAGVLLKGVTGFVIGATSDSMGIDLF